MRNLRLSGKPLSTAEEVVRLLGAVQSQDYGPAKWAVGQRTRGVGDSQMDQCFTDGTVLRTHILRPTWHFVLPEDILWMLELTAPRIHALNAYYYRQLGLDKAVVKKTNALIRRALLGGNQLTRKELAAELNRGGFGAEGLSLGYILMSAELDAIVCSGAMRGKQHTYALLEERASGAKSLRTEEALAELTLRYFTSHGPATAKDFKWWSSLSLADIKTGLEMVASHLEHEVIDGLSFWSSKSSKNPKTVSPPIHLLQGYDEYIVGYSESKHVLFASGAGERLQDMPPFNGLIVLDGHVAGRWKRTLKKDVVIITAALSTRFNEGQEMALQAAADLHGRFLGLPAVLTHP